METVFHQVFNKYRLIVHSLKVMPDHVHIFAEIPPTLSLSKIFQILKGLSSYMLFKKLPHLREHLGKLWSKGKFFESVGSMTDEAVRHYIEAQ